MLEIIAYYSLPYNKITYPNISRLSPPTVQIQWHGDEHFEEKTRRCALVVKNIMIRNI